MAMTQWERISRSSGEMRRGASRSLRAIAVLLLLSASCGPVEVEPQAPELGVTTQEMISLNGLAMNGLAMNGLAMNGLAMNGLAMNGLAMNGLSNESFTSWFQSDPPLAETLMRYMVACALPYGQSRTYMDGGTTHTWYGWLGLAPDWANGAPATLAEQQVISACLAAHANKYGRRVLISVLGRDAHENSLPTFSWELQYFPEREACFFGNLFNGEGLYVGNDRGMLNERESTARACALSTSAEAAREACPPLIYIGSCQGACEKDSTTPSYVRCRYNGITYQPLTTRMRREDIYHCGDHTCQFTESCGSDRRYNSCKMDCGRCR
jgi:hypothetical protein